MEMTPPCRQRRARREHVPRAPGALPVPLPCLSCCCFSAVHTHAHPAPRVPPHLTASFPADIQLSSKAMKMREIFFLYLPSFRPFSCFSFLFIKCPFSLGVLWPREPPLTVLVSTRLLSMNSHKLLSGRVFISLSFRS